jgi:hypothetical protein
MADKILGRVDENRRGFVKRLLGVSFAAPVIASFSVEALSTSTASAQVTGNQPVCLEDHEEDFLFDRCTNQTIINPV